MSEDAALGEAEVSKADALAVIGKVWAGNCGNELWRAFWAGDYAKARDIAARKVAAQDEASANN
ncbi:hypothetical protein [Micromonospora sp. NPDC005174]|uniref:hypothetical protein n=1 Tax=Micromonospora sp. NPDC005174 TaxID=3157018 RepID=UPI0033BB3194